MNKGNQDINTITESYTDLYELLETMHDNVVISDSIGVILWASPSCEITYDISMDQLVGKTIFEMEQQKIFYPSVAALVQKSKKMITIVEQNKMGQKLVVTGIPIVNEKKEIKQVISYSFDPTYLLELQEQYKDLQNLIERYSAEIRELREKEMDFPDVITKSTQMRNVLKRVLKVASVDTNLLLSGESGVGKNLIARMVHQKSTRNEGPFIEINCGAIPENLLESELFGYEPGAFTGALSKGKVGMIELAHTGTLFLDEIGELPLNLQVKLLKVIQDKTLKKIGGNQSIEVDFRLITATNKDLQSLVKDGRFREDLFYRINVIPIHIVPLRERTEDIFSLIMHFLKKFNKQYQKDKTLSNHALDILLAYSWPGNVRELQNIIEQLVVITDENHINAESLPSSIKPSNSIDMDENHTLGKALENYESHIIQRAYSRHKTTGEVAKALGISQASAARKIKKYVKDPLHKSNN